MKKACFLKFEKHQMPFGRINHSAYIYEKYMYVLGGSRSGGDGEDYFMRISLGMLQQFIMLT